MSATLARLPAEQQSIEEFFKSPTFEFGPPVNVTAADVAISFRRSKLAQPRPVTLSAVLEAVQDVPDDTSVYDYALAAMIASSKRASHATDVQTGQKKCASLVHHQ